MKYVIEKSNKRFWGQIGISLLLLALYGAGMPFGLLNISIGNEDMTFVLNMAFISVVTIIVFPTIFKGWEFGLHKRGIWKGITYYGAMPFDKTPGAWSIVSKCIINFFFVGLVEEVLLRGCIFKALLLKFGNNKKGVWLSILISSAIFSLMHIVGAPDDRRIFLMKLLWTFFGGVAFSILYYTTNNLWCVVILHWMLDIAEFPTMFSGKDTYSVIANSALLSSIVTLIFTICFCRREMARFLNK